MARQLLQNFSDRICCLPPTTTWPGNFQVVWRVESIEQEEAEALLRAY
jgi:hypothetical protein